MSNQIIYENLALEWSPISKTDHRFNSIVLVSLLTVILIGGILSSIDIPVEERKSAIEIPERIANLILEQEKKKPVVVPPEKPKPKLKPVIKTEPRVKKKQKKIEKQKPLTKIQKKARERAQESGLLALGNELADLMDTPSINNMVGTRLSNTSSETPGSSSLNNDLLSEGVNKGSAGVNSGKYADVATSNTKLSAQELVTFKQNLIAAENQKDASSKDSQRASGDLRAEEEITLIFDQNKSKIYSLYNRERRKNPGLKGKIVLEITIAPEGKVVSVKIISSELNLPKLETSLLSRIKLFKFSSGKKETVTITYPIEFLPS